MPEGGPSRSNDLNLGAGAWLRGVTVLGLVFLLIPLPVLMFFSFNAGRELTHWEGFSLKWYRMALHNQALWGCVRNTLFIATVSTVVSTALGTLAALVLAKYRFRGRAFFQNLLYIPIVLPEIVFGLSLMILFVLIRLPLGYVSVICSHITFSISFVALIVLARLYRFNSHLEEASLDLGATRLQTFFNVIFPVISPAVVSAALFAFTLSMDDFVITLFTSGAHSATLPLLIYTMVKYGITPEINAISTLMILMTFVILALVGRLQKKAVPIGRLKWICAGIAVVLAALMAAASLKTEESRVLNVYNYAEYIANEVYEGFEKETGIRIHKSYYNSNEELLARLSMGASDYDLIVPSDFMVSIMKKLDLLLPIDFDHIPNIRYIDPAFRRLSYDPDGIYYVPYTYGMSGIIYNSRMIPGPVDSWAVMWDDRYRNRITMLDDMREVFFVGCKMTGGDLRHQDTNELARAYELLLKQKPLLLKYDSSAAESMLLSGSICLAHFWSGGAMRLQLDHDEFRFAMPKEGVAMFVDTLCIPRGARHKENAERFIDYLLRPENSARNMEKLMYPMPNTEAVRLVEPRARAVLETLIGGDLSRCDMFGDLGPFNKALDEAWTRLRSE